MANHLTPDELAQELNIDREAVIRDLHRGRRPDLPGEDRQAPLPGAAAGRGRSPAAAQLALVDA